MANTVTLEKIEGLSEKSRAELFFRLSVETLRFTHENFEPDLETAHVTARAIIDNLAHFLKS